MGSVNHGDVKIHRQGEKRDRFETNLRRLTFDYIDDPPRGFVDFGFGCHDRET